MATPLETVLILGAGASVDYGYPAGKSLCERIYSGKEIRDLVELLHKRRSESDISASLKGLNVISGHFFKSRCTSIDAWLAKNENKDCELAGKLLIAYMITMREDPNKIFYRFHPSSQTNKGQKDWYQLLLNALDTEKLDEFGEKNRNLTIITFNYDRSLEYYLLHALKNRYRGSSDINIVEQLKKIDIFHFYGQVGYLPEWNSKEGIKYAPVPDVTQLLSRVKNIKIIPELRNVESEHLNSMKAKLYAAKRIYFIGFGYDKENLNLLGFPIPSVHAEKIEVICGSCLNMEEGEIKRARELIGVYNNHNMVDKMRRLIVDDPKSGDAYTFFNRNVIEAFK